MSIYDRCGFPFGDFQLEADLVYEDRYGAHWTVQQDSSGTFRARSPPSLHISFSLILGKTPWLRLPLPNTHRGRYALPRGPPFKTSCGRWGVMSGVEGQAEA